MVEPPIAYYESFVQILDDYIVYKSFMGITKRSKLTIIGSETIYRVEKEYLDLFKLCQSQNLKLKQINQEYSENLYLRTLSFAMANYNCIFPK